VKLGKDEQLFAYLLARPIDRGSIDRSTLLVVTTWLKVLLENE
jgi:hypothetical protein